MKFKQYLDEEYVGSFDAGQGLNSFTLGYTEVFKNPSLKEMKSVLETSPWFEHIKNSLRFICDLGFSNLYVFKPTTYHAEVAYFLVGEKEIKYERPTSNIVWGEANLKNGKLNYIDSDARHNLSSAIKKFKGKDDWTEKWFKPSLINSLIEKGFEE